MKRLILLFILVTSAPLSAHATDRVGVAKPEDARAFDSLLKDMSGDFNAHDPALKQLVNRAQERQNQRKANTRDRNSHDVRTRQTPNVSPPTPQRTR
jgi:hypothetical protein